MGGACSLGAWGGGAGPSSWDIGLSEMEPGMVGAGPGALAGGAVDGSPASFLMLTGEDIVEEETEDTVVAGFEIIG